MQFSPFPGMMSEEASKKRTVVSVSLGEPWPVLPHVPSGCGVVAALPGRCTVAPDPSVPSLAAQAPF